MLLFTNSKWKTQWDYDGSVYATDAEGNDVVIVDQYWPNSGHGVENEIEQIGNIMLIINAPEMYLTIKGLIDSTTCNKTRERLEELVKKIEE